jgi:hypothetical protein
VIAINRRVSRLSLMHSGVTEGYILVEGCHESLFIRGDVRTPLKPLVLHAQFLNTARKIKKQAI